MLHLSAACEVMTEEHEDYFVGALAKKSFNIEDIKDHVCDELMSRCS